MCLQIPLITLDKSHEICHKRHYIVPSQNGIHIEVQLTPTFHPTNIKFTWHGHLQQKCVVTYAYMAWSIISKMCSRIFQLGIIIYN
jgi:hypothetical protein